MSSMDSEMEFAISSSTTGKQLFDQVARTIGIREVWYFGLFYKDNTGHDAWIKLNKKVKDQDLPKDSASDKVEFQFRAKFFPEDATEEFIQDVTVHLVFLQIKDSIVNDEIYCPPEAAVLLASYAMQVKYGDNEERHVADIQKDIEAGKVLPKRVRDQHPSFTSHDWANKIAEWHAEHRGMLREETQREYLKIAQDLDMYGVTYFSIKNKKGTDLLLGVDALGINVYEKDNKLTPRIGFPWSEIGNISFQGKNFSIRPIDKKAPEFTIKSEKLKTNKNILAICMGNHDLYLRRRKPESIEVQQMKTEAEQIRKKRQAEKEKHEREKQQLEIAEQKRRELEERLNAAEQRALERERKLKEYEEENSNLRSKISSIQTDISRMERERDELALEKETLAQKVSEGEMTSQEYSMRMQEIQDQYRSVQARLDEKENEAESLRNNLLQTVAEKEAQVSTIETQLKEKLQAEQESKKAVEQKAQELEEEYQRLQLEMATRQHTVGGAASYHSDSSSQGGHANGAGDVHGHAHDSDVEIEEETSAALLSNEGVSNMNSELDREVAARKDQSLAAKLADLSTQLSAEIAPEHLTSIDKQHQENVKQGRDKYKTLNLIRKGNTKERVNEYEAM